MTALAPTRVAAGVPTGGQFATQARSDADISLLEPRGGFSALDLRNGQDAMRALGVDDPAALSSQLLDVWSARSSDPEPAMYLLAPLVGLSGASKIVRAMKSAPAVSSTFSPEVVQGDNRTGKQVLDDALAGRPVTYVTPQGVAKVRAALSNKRGEKDGAVRMVSLNARSTSASVHDRFEVNGPADGRPLIVNVVGGMYPLTVVSGYVIVISDSSWGNSVDFGPGSTGVIIVGEARKISSTIGKDAVVTLYADGQRSHGYQHVVEGGHFTLRSNSSRISWNDKPRDRVAE